MRWTCFISTASDLYSKILCYADFSIYRSSRRKCVTYLFWISLDYWVYALNLRCMYSYWFAFENAFLRRLNIYSSSRRKCFIHICFEFQWIIEYMRWTCFIGTAGDSRSKMLCCDDFIVYRSSQRKCFTYLLWFSLDYWVYALNLLFKYREWFAFQNALLRRL